MSESNPAWWKTAVFYQIYPRSFRDSNGDGVGDLPGIVEKLDYLVELGVDAVWLNPIYPSPAADFGYDVADYLEVDPLFGDLSDLDRLLDEAHTRGLRVLLDLVPNHTSDQHPWFIQSKSSRADPRRDWYIWQDPAPGGGPPNNWLGNFGGSAWTFDPITGQYYLHSFLPEQPDLNLRNPDVQTAILHVLRFWLERGVDGFRVDAAMHLFKDAQFRDNPVRSEPDIGKDRGAVGSQIQYFNANQPEVHPLLKDMRAIVDSFPGDRVLIGEVYMFDPRAAADYYGEGDELHLVPNYALVNLPWEAEALRDSIDAYDQALPVGAQPALMFGSHDESRLASRFGEAAARTAAVLLLTLRGSPILYYGDELGLTDVDVPQSERQDPWGLRTGLPHLGRDPARAPMIWSDAMHAGFSPPDFKGKPWLPMHPDFRQINVQAQRSNPTSVWSLYQTLIRLRRSSLALSLGSYRSVQDPTPALYAYCREHEDERFLIAANFGDEDLTLGLPEPGDGQILLSSNLDRLGPVELASIHLRSHEAIVIRVGLSTRRA